MAYKLNPFTGKFDIDSNSFAKVVSALPGSAATGTLRYLTTNSTLYIYNGGWVAIGSGTPVPPTPGAYIPLGTVMGPGFFMFMTYANDQ